MNTALTAMFIILGVCLLIGVPVAFSIGISSMSYLLLAANPPMTILIQRTVSGASSFTLMALPMFVFSGALMAYGSTPRLMKLANMMLGRVPGGLGAASMVACGFFGAVSGSGVASTAAIGGICGPEMVRNGYGKGITAGLLAAGGAMASLIPPSIVMVVYAASSSASVGDLFIAGIVPGVLTITSLIILNVIIAKKRGMKKNAVTYSLREIIFTTTDAVLPLMMPIIVVGGVLSGLLTATEASAISCVYAFVLSAFVYKELRLKEFFKVAVDSVISSAIILFIISAATPFGWIMATNNLPQKFAEFLLSSTSSPALIMGAIFVLLLILGCFMETICIITLMTPILLPIANSIGIDTVHFGIAMLMNLAVGGCTPPLSVCLFTSCRILDMRIEEAFPDMWYVLLTVTFVALLTLCVPQLSLGLLNLLK